MCGIAGFYSPNFSVDKHQGSIINMLAQIPHRGPDESGYFFDEKAAIGSVRLSVIDLHTGSQPMADESGRHFIAYNGEVYNYKELRDELKQLGFKFRTQSDTEVVLNSWLAWGTAAFAKFNGGFAVAIYDTKSQELVVARDRFGKRPLFYVEEGKSVLFASEMKAFANLPGFNYQWDSQQLSSIFTFWTPLPDQTGFKNIKQLPQASLILMKEGETRVIRYADLEMAGPAFTGSEEEAQEVVQEMLRESVRLRLQSDVEVGVYLSGGLDSSIVALLAKQLNSQPVRTFSVSFADPDFDEASYQEEMSKFLGTNHTTLKVTASDITRDFPEAVFHSEVPLFRTALVPLYALSGMVRNHGVKVVLTGEGSDEGFLGYDIFKETYLLDQWQKGLDDQEKDRLVGSLYPYLKHYSQENMRAISATYNRFAQPDAAKWWAHSIRFSNSSLALRFLKESSSPETQLASYVDEHKEKFAALDPVRQTQWLEFSMLLAGYLLSSQGDRMALAHGVENRCPFLDPNLLAFASSLPVDYRLKQGSFEKHILKNAFKKQLPSSITERFKRPYLAPDACVFLGENKPDYLDSVLTSDELSKIDVLDKDFSLKFVDKLTSGNGAKISPRENQAFLFLLSLSLLDRYFVRKQHPHFTSPPPLTNIVNAIDGRKNKMLSRTLSEI